MSLESDRLAGRLAATCDQMEMQNRDLRGALQACVEQMGQCEKLFRDDEAFMAALQDGRDAINQTKEQQ